MMEIPAFSMDASNAIISVLITVETACMVSASNANLDITRMQLPRSAFRAVTLVRG